MVNRFCVSFFWWAVYLCFFCLMNRLSLYLSRVMSRLFQYLLPDEQVIFVSFTWWSLFSVYHWNLPVLQLFVTHYLVWWVFSWKGIVCVLLCCVVLPCYENMVLYHVYLNMLNGIYQLFNKEYLDRTLYISTAVT